MATLNITKRGTVWQYRFEVAPIDGKRKQISKSGFRTKKECEQAGTKALNEYNNAGMHFEPSTVSIADYLDYWLDTYCKMNLKYGTQLNYTQIVEYHLKPNLGAYRLNSLQASTIQQYVNNIKLEGYSRSHVIGIISTLSGALNYAVEPLHYIKVNPCNNIKYPKFEKKNKGERYIISLEQFDKIVERFNPDTPFHLPLMIAYYTGLRTAEIFGLTWDDIDMDARTLTVNKIVVKRNCGGIDVKKVLAKRGTRLDKTTWYFGSPKTSSSIRTIKFGQTLYNVLKQARSRQLADEMLYGEYYTKNYKKAEKDEKGETIYKLMNIDKVISSPYPPVNFICLKPDGSMLSPDSMKYPMRVIRYELGIACNMHSLRHTHATLLIQNGANVKDVQTRLGHADIKTTLNTYVHDTDEMQNQTVDIFEKLVIGK